MRRAVVAICTAVALVAGACGDDEPQEAAAPKPKPGQRVDVNKDPLTITCNDLADKEASARMSRTATFTLADQMLEEQPKLAEVSNRNLLAQRIFIGMVELCEDGDPALTPAEQAMAGVAEGDYQLEPPDEKYVGD
jgi:hypothetical protein